jgi:release factor glutamine methyltransferase
MKPTASPKQDLTSPDTTSKSLLKAIQSQIKDHSKSPYLDGLVLLSHLTGLTKSQLLADHELNLTADQENQLEDKLNRIKDGVPLPYALGQWEFYQLQFKVTPEVLIPRPETEGLVDRALEWLRNHPEKRTLLEVGTGSGCIAISLAKSIPDLTIFATDISSEALKVARENAETHQVKDQIIFLEKDLLQGINKKVDLLVTNLPYIPTAKLKKLPVIRSEPLMALDGGQDGLHYIKEVLKNAEKILHKGSAIFLELDEDCGAAALALAKEIWTGITLKLERDFSGLDRYLIIQL